jgi:hypothetical protein
VLGSAGCIALNDVSNGMIVLSGGVGSAEEKSSYNNALGWPEILSLVFEVKLK